MNGIYENTYTYIVHDDAFIKAGNVDDFRIAEGGEEGGCKVHKEEREKKRSDDGD